MKQVAQSYRNGELALVEVPPPGAGIGHVLVRTVVSLISPGTEKLMLEMARKSLLGKARERPDLVRQALDKARREGIGPTIQAVLSRLDAPVPLGYSSAGMVIEVGEGIDDCRSGDAVACAGAGYAVHAEFVSVPRNLYVPILRPWGAHGPERGQQSNEGSISLEAAAFTTVGAIALQGVRVADVRIGEVVVVIGLGLVGLLTVQLLKAAGCRVLGFDPKGVRCRLAELIGCDMATADNTELLEHTAAFVGGHGVDAALITAGTSSNGPIELAARLCREKGRVVAVGAVNMDVPRRPFYEKELDLRLSRSYGPGRYDPLYEEKGIDYPYGYVRWTERRNMAAFLDLVVQGRVHVEPLITHRFPIERALEAYELITQDEQGEAVGVLLTYGSVESHLGSEDGIARLSRTVHISNTPKPTSDQVRIGMIGAGAFAKSVLLPILKCMRGVQLATLCTATGLSAQSTAKKFGFAACTTDPEAIFDDSQVHAVLIATRHHLHAPLAIRALQAGKHVFVEKPLALDEEQLHALLKAVDSDSAARLMVGFNRRFAPLTQRIKQVYETRKAPLAIHYRVNAGFVPPEHWLHDPHEGGGRIIGEVCHFVDWMHYLTGVAPRFVYAQALPGGGRHITEDNVLITVTFGDGSVGTIHYLANGDPRVPKERIEVFGNGVVAIIEDFQSGAVFQQGKRMALGHRLWSRQDKGHAAELGAFMTAVKADGRAPIPLESAVLVTLTTLKIHDSLRENTPMPIDLGILPTTRTIPGL